MKRLMLASLSALLAVTAAAGEVYTWKDKSGRVHYSDTPPADVDVKPLRTSPASEGTGTSSSSLADKNRAFNERQATQAAEAKKTADAQAKADVLRQHCAQLRNRIASFETGGRIAKTVDGERVIMGDDERLAEIERMKAQVARDCKE